MRLLLRRFHILFLFLALLCARPALAQNTPATLLVPIKNLKESAELRDSKNKKFLCVNLASKKKDNWQSGEKKKTNLWLDKPRIDELKKKKKKLKNAGHVLAAKEDKLLTRLLARYQYCRSLKWKEKDPEKAPVAHGGSKSGEGIEPVAITLEVTPAEPGLPVACIVTGMEGEAVVENQENCNLLIRPKDHVRSRATLKFVARHLERTEQSNEAAFTIDWNQSGEFKGDYRSIAAYKPELSYDEIMHVVRWEALGSNRNKLFSLAAGANGRENLINGLLFPDEKECDAIEAQAKQVASARFAVGEWWLSKPIDVNRDGVADDTDGDGFGNWATVYYRDTLERKAFWTMSAANAYWLHKLRAGCQPMRERLALLFHNHFATNLWNLQYWWMYSDTYIPDHLMFLSGRYAEGERIYPSLDKIVSKLHSDGAMLTWLNNYWNAWYGSTNENYARELMELFTLGPLDIVTGAKNFIEKDIYEMSYALTGYVPVSTADSRNVGSYCCYPYKVQGTGADQPGCYADTPCTSINTNRPSFSETNWNDVQRPRGQQLFAGTTWEKYEAFKANSLAGGQDTITPYLFNAHPGVARYFAARLMASFAGLDIGDDTLEDLASQLRTDSFHIEGILKTILGSSSYFSKEARTDCVSAPAETFVSFINLFDLPLTSTTSVDLYAELTAALGNSGQYLLAPPSVFGWQECGKISGNKIHNGEFWVTSQMWLERIKGMTNYLNKINQTKPTVNFDWKTLLPPGSSDQRKPRAIVAHFAATLGVTLTDFEQATLEEYLNNISTENITDANNNSVPNPFKIQAVDLAKLTEAEFNDYWNLKGPGLLELFFGLKIANVK